MGAGASDLGECCVRSEDPGTDGALEVVTCTSKDLQNYLRPVSVRVPNGVTNLNDGAFRDCKMVCSVILPVGLRSIGESAFRGCTALRTVSMPNTVWKIGSGAFSGCHSLRIVNIPTPVTDIEDETFSGCKALEFVGMPPYLLRVGNWAFFSCESLEHVDLPQSVAHIGTCAFYSCSGINSVSIPRSVTVLERGTFAFCRSLTDVDVPDTILSVGAWAFRDCSSLTSMKLPRSVTTIGQQAFAWCSSLRSMKVPPSVTSIGPGAFASCVLLGRVEIPESVVHIGDGAFIWCVALTSVEVGPATSMGDDVFFGCGTKCIMQDAAIKNRARGLVGLGSPSDAAGASPGATCTTACSEDDLRAPEPESPEAGRTGGESESPGTARTSDDEPPTIRCLNSRQSTKDPAAPDSARSEAGRRNVSSAPDLKVPGGCQDLWGKALPVCSERDLRAEGAALPDEVGLNARVNASGREGIVVKYDPKDEQMTYKVKFADGADPLVDWLARDKVDVAGAAQVAAPAPRRHVASAPDLAPQLARDRLRGAPAAGAALQAARREALRRELQDRRRSPMTGASPELAAQLHLRLDASEGHKPHPEDPSSEDLLLRRREELRRELRQRQLSRDHTPMASGDESCSAWSLDQRVDYRQQMEIAKMERADVEEQHLRRARAPDSRREEMQRGLSKAPALGMAQVVTPLVFISDPEASRTTAWSWTPPTTPSPRHY